MINISKVLDDMGFSLESGNIRIEQIPHEEDDSYYRVWRIIDRENKYILKQAKHREAEIYRIFLREIPIGVPRLLCETTWEGETYLLLEYIEGTDLSHCDRERLTQVLDALIYLQNHYWACQRYEREGYTFENSLAARADRGNYLKDDELEETYQIFLERYASVPRTFCHDDLLPFNVLVSDRGAAIIDWEIGGMLPYPTPLVRLIAHGEETEDAFFYMTEADRAFAVDYYYEHLVASKGIPYAEYRETVDLFLLYEYCEWIMLGNKYEDADMERCRKYLGKAKHLIHQIKSGGK